MPPWPVPGHPAEEEVYVRETPLGLAAILGFVFADNSVILSCGFPGGSRYMRISPETDWSMEEVYEGELAEEIADEINKAWGEALESFAEQNKGFRKQREFWQGK